MKEKETMNDERGTMNEKTTTSVHGSAFRVHHSDIRIILWDIDGTLVRSHRPGEFTRYMIPTLERVFGTAGRLGEFTVSGMTDMQIALESLSHQGHTHETIRLRLDDWQEIFMHEMERVTAEHAPFFYRLPGSIEALEAVGRNPRYLSSLLTGNIHPAAMLKLRLVGLEEFFTLPGAFGEDSHDRRDLPAIAHNRLEAALGFALDPAQLIIIGDTPNDIFCARHHGCRSIAVATGRSHTADQLRAHNPDALLTDLRDTNLLLSTLAEL
jgi:phosphoglycolate phosphatase-like HAD superfamily hydrolase